jgi:2-oxoglutarate ferredoxin oxidoreductase subunit alpha
VESSIHSESRITFLIGGEAGQGITRSGSVLGKTLMRAGLQVFGANDYPSIIRGGHNFYILTASLRKVYSQDDRVDLVIALNKETVLLHQHELNEGGGIVYDKRIEFEVGEITREDIRLYPVPLTDIVAKVEGPSIMRNSVSLGAAIAIVGLDPKHLEGVIAEAFAGRTNIVESNVKAIRMGHDYAREHHEFDDRFKTEESSPSRIMVTGSEAIALGAIRAGCQFYAAYPMTPASALLHYLISKDEDTGMVVLQAESEIAAVTMTVGASYAGLRSMTGTSGGGFCLMTEGFGDLLFAIHASQGEFPRVVVAPGDVDDCFTRTIEAFNLAEKYQVPAIILGDKHLLESHNSTEPFTEKIEIDRGELYEAEEWAGEEYRRYRITESGVSPRIILGTRGATMLANGNEHDEYGFTTIDPLGVVAMADKRFRKSKGLADEISRLEPVKVFGTGDPDVTLVGWGSTKGPVLEALRLLEREGIGARFVQIVYMEPFPSKDFIKAMNGPGKSILLETNITNQLGRLIKEHTGFEFDNVHSKYNGRPYSPEEIAAMAGRLI